VKSTFDRRIENAEFRSLVAPILGLPISRPWRGYGSALFLELGELHDEPLLPSRRRPEGDTSQKGQATIMIEWSWRVERARSIAFGSWSTERRMTNGVARLVGHRIEAIDIVGRLPEVLVQLSDGLWLQTFNTSEGQPEWTVFLPDESWVTVIAGHVVHNIQNQTPVRRRPNGR
jgi:hypothetical protein